MTRDVSFVMKFIAAEHGRYGLSCKQNGVE